MRLLTTDTFKPKLPLIEFLPRSAAVQSRALDALDFTLPPELEAHAPPEAHGLRRDDVRHRRIARWTLPIWLYVSVTGVVIYLMLYRLG